MLHPGASQPKRLWLLDRFAYVIDYLHDKEYSPVLLCGPSDHTIVELIKSKCKMPPHVLSIPLEDIAAYLACCEIFIGMDSGIAHIAAAVGIDAIVLFGPQQPALTAPRGNALIQIIRKGDFACRPCDGAACQYNNACMKAIKEEDVIEAVEQLISKK